MVSSLSTPGFSFISSTVSKLAWPSFLPKRLAKLAESTPSPVTTTVSLYFPCSETEITPAPPPQQYFKMLTDGVHMFSCLSLVTTWLHLVNAGDFK